MSGGFVPPQMRGKRSESMMHVADWYSTLTQGIAGMDPTDKEAEASGLPPIDSLNMWPTLSGKVQASPRDSVGILVNKNTLVFGRWKYIRGGEKLRGWSVGNAEYPTEEAESNAIDDKTFQCPPAGCLFDVVTDPTEREELSAQRPEQVRWMRAEMEKQAASIWSINNIRPEGTKPWQNKKACDTAARELYHGFLGPFLEVGLPEVSRQNSSGPGTHIHTGRQMRNGKLALRASHDPKMML